MPFTLNRYGYCYNNGVLSVDLNGMWPNPIKWVKNKASKAVKAAGSAVKAVGKFCEKHKKIVGIGIGSSVYSSVSSGTDLLTTIKNAGISGTMQLFFSGIHTGLYEGFTDLDSFGKFWIGLHKYACDIGGSTVFGDLIINSANKKHKKSNSKNNIEKE